MKKTNPSFNSFSPFSLFNPFFSQTITIAIVITVHYNDCQQHMQPALSPPPSPLPCNRYGARVGGPKYYAVNRNLRLFLYHFLHTMSL